MEKGYLILMVDDEQEIVELVKDYLVREGFRVVTAGDGQGALEAARTTNRPTRTSPPLTPDPRALPLRFTIG
ncbi:MAG: hypothetical protein M0Z31_02500 [Clostridia bacterium]|nr:hypothetical protein [Clostridia bacterium]